jgi:hypothetical protein
MNTAHRMMDVTVCSQRTSMVTLRHRKFIATAAAMACSISISASAWALGGTVLKDVRITAVRDVDFRGQTQFDLSGKEKLPSRIISQIEFTTDTDLLVLAKKKNYNVSFVVGPCEKEGVKDNGKGIGGVYWNKVKIYFGTKDIPGYAEASAKGTPFTYQVYTEKLPLNSSSSLCLTLAGGSMTGKKLHSNNAVIPAH